MCKRYGQETEKTHQKAGVDRRTESEPTPDNEDGQEYKDLERPTRKIIDDYSGVILARYCRPYRSFITSYYRRNFIAQERKEARQASKRGQLGTGEWDPPGETR